MPSMTLCCCRSYFFKGKIKGDYGRDASSLGYDQKSLKLENSAQLGYYYRDTSKRLIIYNFCTNFSVHASVHSGMTSIFEHTCTG